MTGLGYPPNPSQNPPERKIGHGHKHTLFTFLRLSKRVSNRLPGFFSTLVIKSVFYFNVDFKGRKIRPGQESNLAIMTFPKLYLKGWHEPTKKETEESRTISEEWHLNSQEGLIYTKKKGGKCVSGHTCTRLTS